MTTLPRCPRCSAFATGPALHGTDLVLCPACWAVVAPPVPTPSHPARTVPALSEELAKLPYLPRPRTGPLFARGFFLGLAFFALVPIVGYFGWSYRKDHPRFQDFTSPGGEYTVAFPDTPNWYLVTNDFETGLIPSARAERDTGFWPEHYQVRVLWLGRTRANGQQSSEAIARGWATTTRAVSTDLSFAVAEFEVWNEVTKSKSAGRVIVARDYAYELTVSGRGVSLADQRVQRFFESFRIGR